MWQIIQLDMKLKEIVSTCDNQKGIFGETFKNQFKIWIILQQLLPVRTSNWCSYGRLLFNHLPIFVTEEAICSEFKVVCIADVAINRAILWGTTKVPRRASCSIFPHGTHWNHKDLICPKHQCLSTNSAAILYITHLIDRGSNYKALNSGCVSLITCPHEVSNAFISTTS